MSVGSIIGGGAGLLGRRPGTVALWAVMYVVGAFAMMRLFQPLTVRLAMAQHQVAASAAAGVRAPPPFPAEAFSGIFLIEFVAAILGIVAFAAVVRATAWDGGDRFAFLRLGMDELRLLGLAVVLAVFAFAVEMVVIVALFLVGGLVGVALGKGAGVAVGVILALLLLPVAIYIEVRISLAPVFTVLRRQIVLGPAWHATRGRFWTLFGAYAVLTLAFVALSLIVFALTNPHLLAAYLSFDHQAVNVALQEQLLRQAAGLPVAMLVPTILGSILSVVMGVIAIGSITTAAIECGALDPVEV